MRYFILICVTFKTVINQTELHNVKCEKVMTLDRLVAMFTRYARTY